MIRSGTIPIRIRVGTPGSASLRIRSGHAQLSICLRLDCRRDGLAAWPTTLIRESGPLRPDFGKREDAIGLRESCAFPPSLSFHLLVPAPSPAHAVAHCHAPGWGLMR